MPHTSAGERNPRGQLDHWHMYEQLERESTTATNLIFLDVPAMKPWLDLLHHHRGETHLSAIQMLGREMFAFQAYTLPTGDEHTRRRGVVKRLESFLQQTYPGLVMHMAGSYLTRTYLPNGDIDVTLTWPQSKDVYGAGDYPNNFLEHIAEIFKVRKGEVLSVEHIKAAKVPIVRLKTAYCSFTIDISVDTIDSIVTGQLVRHCLATQPAMRSILMIMKLFLGQRNLNEPKDGGLSTYALVLLIYSYLQLKSRLCRPTASLPPGVDSFGALLLDFLFYYGKVFRFPEVAISVRGTGNHFFPAERDWISTDGRRRRLEAHGPYIEDPFDPRKNVASACRKAVRLAMTFSLAYDKLSELVSRRQSHIDSSSGKAWGEYIDPLDINGGSLLGSLIGFHSKEVLTRRQMNIIFPLGPLQALMRSK